LRGEAKQREKESGDPYGGRLCLPREKTVCDLPEQEDVIKDAPVFIATTPNDFDEGVEILARYCAMIGVGSGDVLHFQPNPWELISYLTVSDGTDRRTFQRAVSLSTIAPIDNIPAPVPPFIDMQVHTPRLLNLSGYTDSLVVIGRKKMFDWMADYVAREGRSVKELGYRLMIFRDNRSVMNAEDYKKACELWGAEIYRMLDIQYNLFFALECPEHSGLHAWEDKWIIESVDPQTGEAASTGKLTVTNLFAEATPVIRYMTDIDVSLNKEPCGCGRTNVRIIPSGY
jgi:phenylacetate-CoA ligase